MRSIFIIYYPFTSISSNTKIPKDCNVNSHNFCKVEDCRDGYRLQSGTGFNTKSRLATESEPNNSVKIQNEILFPVYLEIELKNFFIIKLRLHLPNRSHR